MGQVTWHMSVQGRFSLRNPDGEEIRFATKREELLLVILALSNKPFWDRSELANTIWFELRFGDPRSNLRGALSSLRAKLPHGAIESDSDRIRLCAEWLIVENGNVGEVFLMGHSHPWVEVMRQIRNPAQTNVPDWFEQANAIRESDPGECLKLVMEHENEWEFMDWRPVRELLVLALQASRDKDTTLRSLAITAATVLSLAHGSVHERLRCLLAQPREMLQLLDDPGAFHLTRALSTAALSLGRESAAVSKGEVGVELAAKMNSQFHEAAAKLHLAMLYLHCLGFDQATYWAKSAERVFESIGSQEGIEAANTLMLRAHLESENWNAFEHVSSRLTSLSTQTFGSRMKGWYEYTTLFARQRQGETLHLGDWEALLSTYGRACGHSFVCAVADGAAISACQRHELARAYEYWSLSKTGRREAGVTPSRLDLKSVLPLWSHLGKRSHLSESRSARRRAEKRFLQEFGIQTDAAHLHPG